MVAYWNRGHITYSLGSIISTCQRQVCITIFDSNYHAMKNPTPEAEVNSLIYSQYRYADYYNKILRTNFETNTRIRKRLNRLNKLDFTTGYPLLLHLYNIHSSGEMGIEEFLACLKLLENFMVRFFLAGESTNKLNRHFPTIISSVQRKTPLTH